MTRPFYFAIVVTIVQISLTAHAKTSPPAWSGGVMNRATVSEWRVGDTAQRRSQ